MIELDDDEEMRCRTWIFFEKMREIEGELYVKLQSNFVPTPHTSAGSWLYGTKGEGAWKERVGEKDQGFPPQNIPRIEIFSGGNSYTAVKCAERGTWPAHYWTWMWPAGHPP